MFRWHGPTCSKPFINVVGGLPWCQTCCAVPPVNEDLDFRDELDPPRPPSRKSGQCRTLAWPPSVKYQKEDAGDKDEDLRNDHIGTALPLQNASADGSNHLQAPLDGIKTAKHKSCCSFLPPRSIRILDITPGGPDDLLHGNFRVVQLSKDSPHYEALSYTWADAAGNSQRCRAMYIGPFWDIVPITKNCDHALCSVWPRNDRLMQRTLWIDSVCVSQGDVIERTSQVALMPEIYSSAAEVLVYLGLATDSSNLALEAISRSLTTNDCSHSQEKSMCKICQSAIFELFERPYFRRLWVVQEIILSRSITMFCGALSSSLPFSRMLELLPIDAWTIRRVSES
ncbi:heterokaryon incompatibility protein [Colletotrichum asianum]|uniref:Heterokaryon incompatibility protein n=1 Tax=Colletotrichum asianum TaxID=702518 RepID=A0A8H3ZLF7_9PEZI|nr:heterokaryon incompatibility protein [Colletotrichum asianum]